MKTILLIEDNIQHARLVRRILEPHHYRFLHASNGESGLRMAIEQSPDLILLDLGLPDLDGQTVAALIKSTANLARVPLVAITAWPPDTAKAMAKAYGCDGYISKPIVAREFASQIGAYLEEA
jgi:two-component system cell cycle response regulator DivK